jgi:ribosome-associated toxin RatA of RatAB toxin-antitoxin module
MKDASDSSSPPEPARIKKRIVIPVIFISAAVLLMIVAVIRGNWTDAEPRNPSSPADSVVAQILRTAEGRKQIRCAAIVASSPEQVWKVVTDYDHFSEIFPHISTSKGVRESDGRWHITGEIRSVIGHWPMDLHVQHEESAPKFVASWDEPYGSWKVNRGSWVITPHGSGETLLEYNLELNVSPFPDFVVRTVLLDQLKPVLKAVANRAQQSQPRR